MRINKLFLLVLAILVLPLGSSAFCQNVNPINNVPCDIITPVLTCSGTAQLSNINSSINYTVPMTALGDGTYKIVFNYPIGEYYIILCDNSTTSFTVTPVGNPTYYPNNPPSATGSRTIVSNPNYTIAVQLSQYPYADINLTETVLVEILKNMTSFGNLTNTLIITELNGTNTTINIPYDNPSGFYKVVIGFDKVGNYPFIIKTNGTDINTTIGSGTILVRKAFDVFVRLFNKDLTGYTNNYGFVTAEFESSRKIDSNIEPFFYPISTSSAKSPVFHANYIDGTAKLRLFENGTNYVYRFVEGVSFNTTYEKPTGVSIKNINMFLGTVYSSGNSTLLQFVLSDKDKDSYKWLFNWATFILLVLVALGSFALFMGFPDKPQIAFVFGILFGVMIIVGRTIIFFWQNF